MTLNQRSRTRQNQSPSPSARSPRRGFYGILAVAGLAGVASLAFLMLRPSAPAVVATKSPDIILITIDTLRADALGYAGNARVKTPFLDRLASGGVVFMNAHAHNVVTLPSHANILTGLLPFKHGIRDNAGFILDAANKTIATRLRELGYATGAFVGAFPLDARFGLNAGFDEYDDRYREGSGRLDFEVEERPASEVLAAARRWYDENAGKKRFLWIHLYDPHAPYRPAGRFAEEYRDNAYLGEVAATDDALQQFLSPILSSRPETFVVVTADHGEALGDHGEQTHGLFAYESTLRVPLIIHDPQTLQHAVETSFVRHIDIAPTILDRIGAAIPPELEGTSLLRDRSSRDTYFESLSSALNRGWAPLVGMIHGSHKYIDLPLAELYDLDKDAAETKNLFDDQRRVVAKARSLLAAMAPGDASNVSRNVSTEDARKLMSLGYVTGTAANKDYGPADDPKNLIGLDTKMHRIVETYQRGKTAEAVKLAREVVAERRDMIAAQEMLAFVLQQNEQPREAIESLRSALTDGTASESLKIRLGLILSETGNAKEAVAILAPFADRRDPEILNAYGIALADTGDIQGAVRQFDRVLQIDPTNATAYENLGVVALRANQPERAQAYLMRALGLNDRMPLALNTLGVLYARAGKTNEAIDAWTRAVSYDPHLFDALYNLAVVSGRAGRFDVARDALTRFIATAPPERYGRDLDDARKMLAGISQRATARSF